MARKKAARVARKTAKKAAVVKSKWKFEQDVREVASAYLLEALDYAAAETSIKKVLADPYLLRDELYSNKSLQGPARDRARVALYMLTALRD